jgi:hypothetical protein
VNYLDSAPAQIALFVAIFFGVIAFNVHMSVLLMGKTPDLIPAPELAPEIINKMPPGIAEFLKVEGFGSPEFYRFNQVILCLWLRESAPPVHRFCFARTATTTTFELEAQISERASLTTTRSGVAFMFPRQFGEFTQSFPGADVVRLWKLHLEGTEFLISHSIVSVGPCREAFPASHRRSVVEQLTHVRSLPLWPVRGIYWYLVKRFLMRNRPIWKQDIAKLYWRASESQTP